MILGGLMCRRSVPGEPLHGLLRLDWVKHTQNLHTLCQDPLHDAQLQRQQAAHSDLPGEAHTQAARDSVVRIGSCQGVPLLLGCSTQGLLGLLLANALRMYDAAGDASRLCIASLIPRSNPCMAHRQDTKA